MSVAKEVLAVFARAPELGRVKTRLCPPLTADEAVALHRALVGDTLENLGKLPRQGVERVLLLSQPLKRSDDLDVPKGWTVGIQTGGDLGARLENLFSTSLRRGAARVVVLGSDSPTLPLEIVSEAFDRLVEDEIVVGPAEDGGYYLLGCRRLVPELFHGIPWGTSEVLSATKAVLDASGRPYSLLLPWYDIDRSDDLVKLRQEIAYLERATPSLVPRRVAAALPDAGEDYSLGADVDIATTDIDFDFGPG